jgi:hypothetical protein
MKSQMLLCMQAIEAPILTSVVYALLICGVYFTSNPVYLVMKANIFLLSLVGCFICTGSIGKTRYLALWHVDVWSRESDEVASLYLWRGIMS